MSSALEDWRKVLGDAFTGLSSWWNSLVAPVLGAPTETRVGTGPLTLEGTLRNPDGSVIPNAKLTLRNTRYKELVLGTGVSSSEGKYRFIGAPRTNFILDVEEPGKWKRTVFIDIIKRIEGIPVQPGMVVPVDLTVAFPELPTVTFKVAPPPMPEYKRVEIPPYKPEPERIAKVIYA